MTHEYTLAPFTPSSSDDVQTEGANVGEWTVATTMYGLDLHCEPAMGPSDTANARWNSTTGCYLATGFSGNFTQGEGKGIMPTKEFSATCVGYWGTSISSASIDECPPERNHTFFAGFTRNKLRKEDPPQTPTGIFCEPFYYQQDVIATVDSNSNRPTKVTPQGDKLQLPADMFNTTWLEMMMNGGSSGVVVRGDTMPDSGTPSWYGQMIGTNVSFDYTTQPMAAMAIVSGNRPLEEYLDSKVLAESYEKAWRLLFARGMTDALRVQGADANLLDGNRTVTTNAVVLEPTFTYIVEGLLAVVSILASVLLWVSNSRTTALSCNPKSLASVMSLVADNEALLAEFARLDCSTLEQLQEAVQQKTYKLVDEDDGIRWDFDITLGRTKS
jgi:hypothetical protein